jgi:lipopolysaccharide assembly outer membrane protein LptD (OstA)
MRHTIGTLLSACLLIHVAFAKASGAKDKLAPVLSSLKKVTLDAQRSQIEQTYLRGSGNAHLNLEYQDEKQNVDLHADTILVDFEKRRLEAQNNVRLHYKDPKGQSRSITGAALRYDFEQQRGTLDSAQIAVEQLTFRGDQIEVQMRDDTIGVRSALLTLCQQPHPHFSLRAKEIKVTLQEEATVRGVSFFWGRRKLFTLPSYTFSLPGASQAPKRRNHLPSPSYNSRDGLFLRSSYSFPLSVSPSQPIQGLFGNVDLGYSMRRGLRGGPSLMYRTSLPLPSPGEKATVTLELKEKWRDGVHDHLDSRLLVDRRPELELRAHPFTVVPKRLVFEAIAAAGKYHEFPSGISSSREHIAFEFDTRAPGSNSVVYGRLSAQKSWYSNSEMRAVRLEVGLQGRVGRQAKGRISYQTTDIKGFTPFEFDEIQIPQEIRTTLDLRLDRNWIIPIDLRYDLDRNRFRDKQFGLVRTLDCVGYGLSYDAARKEVKLEFRLLGKDGF